MLFLLSNDEKKKFKNYICFENWAPLALRVVSMKYILDKFTIFSAFINKKINFQGKIHHCIIIHN